MRLDGVSLTHLVRFIIPRRQRIGPNIECSIIQDAIDDYMKMYPDVKSQAGSEKMQPVVVDKNSKQSHTIG